RDRRVRLGNDPSPAEGTLVPERGSEDPVPRRALRQGGVVPPRRGIAEFVEDLNHASNALFRPPIFLHAKRDSTDIELALQYTDGYNETTLEFVNNIHTIDGGTHVVGLRAGLTRTLNDY